MNLINKTILITRNIEQAQEFAELIKTYGGNPIIFPTIEIKKRDSLQDLDNYIHSLNEFDGIIFTSQNAVKIFFERFREAKNLDFDKFLVFAVGEKTRLEIEKQHWKCTAIPDSYNAEMLAELIQTYGIKQKRFLFPRGNISRELIVDKLKGIGAEIISVVVYETTCPIPTNSDEIKKNLLTKRIDVVTFTSPSSVINFFKIFSEDRMELLIKSLTKIAVIGNTTADALIKLNLQPDIIANPSTIDGLLKSIIKYFDTNQSNTASTD